jgi:hypothetical protein
MQKLPSLLFTTLIRHARESMTQSSEEVGVVAE